jgi:hypothetical protein
MKDAFDLWWGWATKPRESMLSIDGDIHYPIMGRKIGAIARRSMKLCVSTKKVRSAVPKPRRAPHDLLPATHRGAYHRLARARWALTYPL